MLSAKWLYDVQHHKGPELPRQASMGGLLTSVFTSPPVPRIVILPCPLKREFTLDALPSSCHPYHSSSLPSVIEPAPSVRTSARLRAIVQNRVTCGPISPFEVSLQQSPAKHTFPAFCELFKNDHRTQSLLDNSLPTPPSKGSIVKALYSLGVPRERLRFVTLWMCNFAPHVRRKCVKCGRNDHQGSFRILCSDVSIAGSETWEKDR